MRNLKLQNFIAQKIQDLKYAIFYCHNNDDCFINNSLICTSTVNERGNILFFIDRPGKISNQSTQEISVGLNYFQKGKSYFMNVLGKAKVIWSADEAAAYTGQHYNINEYFSDKVLVVVTITKVDFWDTNFERKNTFQKMFWYMYSSLFQWFGNVSKSYHLARPDRIHQFGL